jgi:hypothetical protein
MNDFTKEINGHILEYFDDDHLYLVDGIIVPSITEILKVRFGGKYDHVDRQTLQRASEAGTQVHDAVEHFVRTGEITDIPEVRNFIFLQRQYGFNVVDVEEPVILWMDGEPICAGRCDLVIEMDGQIGGADIKRTSALDRQYLSYQLNLYRTAYRQSYGVEWEFLRGIHLREDVRRFVNIPINEDVALEIVNEWRKL